MQKLICRLVSCIALTAAAHGETVGVVMMHGKHGTPGQLQQLAGTVADAGFAVERPEMCWSAARITIGPTLNALPISMQPRPG